MNWGYKLLFCFIAFGAGMFYLVYRTMSTNFELVENDYYNSELKYQQVIDAAKRTATLKQSISFTQNNQEVIISVPATTAHQQISGKVYFYCAYMAKNDRTFNLKPEEGNRQAISKKLLAPGNYTVKLSWNAGGENYYSEHPLTIN